MDSIEHDQDAQARRTRGATERSCPELVAPPPATATVPGRYFYLPPTSDGYGWVMPTRPINTREGHERVIAGFNRRDKGRLVWKWEEVLPTDYDHPDKSGTKIDRLRAENDKLKALLRGLEWSGSRGGMDACPRCGKQEWREAGQDGARHAPDCELAAALK